MTGWSASDRLTRVVLDDAEPRAATDEIEQDRRVALFDLEESNRFALPEGPPGPYRLSLGRRERRVTFDLVTQTGEPATSFALSLASLDQALKDYRDLCDAYADAVKTLPPARIEAVDAARREIHMEASRQLRAQLHDRARMDEATARRLFTLICALSRDG